MQSVTKATLLSFAVIDDNIYKQRAEGQGIILFDRATKSFSKGSVN